MSAVAHPKSASSSNRTDNPLRRRRGFSVLELSIAMAIAGVVVAAAASSAVMVTRVLKLDAKKSAADQDTRRLVDFVLSKMQAVGGGPVRPWMALRLEETAGADRLTLIDVDDSRRSCEIDAITTSTISFKAICRDDPQPANFDACINVACCYDWDGVPETGTPATQYEGETVMLVKGRTQWVARKIGSQTAGPATPPSAVSGCTMSLESVAAYNPLGSWVDSPVSRGGITQVSGNNYEGGTATPIQIRVLTVADDLAVPAYPGQLVPTLMEWFDNNRNGAIDAGENRVVFPGVVDLQVALGYDSLPEDGRVIETNAAQDEWFGTIPSDTIATATAPTQLRMAKVGVVVATKAVDGGVRTVSVLNGPSVTRSDAILRRALGEALLRNIAVFY